MKATTIPTAGTSIANDRTVVRPMPVEKSLAITVLMGGPGAEREVSLQSGEGIAAALESVGHRVKRADIGPDDLAAIEIEADLVFIALHGTFGEDGALQRILESRGVRFTGSDSEASARSMNKVQAKAVCVAEGVPTPRFDVLRKGRLKEAVANWVLPAVIKPVADGSSVGCRIIREEEELLPAAEERIAEYGECMIEQYIEGMELSVGVLGDQALPPIQIRTWREFYDYQAKYEDEDTEYLLDIDLPRDVQTKICEMSLQMHRALGCRHMSRVDWMVDRQTQAPYFLEVNTIPGCTSHSLLPKAAAKAGLSYADLCQRVVELAMKE